MSSRTATLGSRALAVLGVLLLTALALPASAHAAPVLDRRPRPRLGALRRTPTGSTGTLDRRRRATRPARRSCSRAGATRTRAPTASSIATTTDAEGKFTLQAELDRNHRLRVTAPAQSVESDVLQAYTLPGFELSFRAAAPGVVRLYQRYTVPKQVRLTAPTLFYLGPRGAKRASIRGPASSSACAPATTRRRSRSRCPRAGTARSATRAASAPSAGSGMGDPDQAARS